tara:strand:+ start:66 stop:377 length:312 start_codon:yes stop_codon:yes gene_type:complete
MKSLDESVFRIFKKREFKEFKEEKYFYGNNFDKKSGYIHLSLRTQIKGTIATHFFRQKVIIAEFNVMDLEKLLKWEKSRDSMVFPHYFGALEFRWVRNIFKNY